jgi:hypothetical protein
MPKRIAVAIATAALLLECAPRALAHGDEYMDMSAHDAPQPQLHDGGEPTSYWGLSEHVTLMYCHIALEILAWVVILPIGKLPLFLNQESN